AFTTVAIADAYGRPAPFILVSVLLAAYAVLAWFLVRDAPGRATPSGSFLARTWATVKIPATSQLALIYAMGFGGFVAFSVYLPTYLTTAFELSRGDAS